eukprot:scaffold8637_cov153-Skeletonema_dohrnii-CCMP3373.AAC.5
MATIHLDGCSSDTFLVHAWSVGIFDFTLIFDATSYRSRFQKAPPPQIDPRVHYSLHAHKVGRDGSFMSKACEPTERLLNNSHIPNHPLFARQWLRNLLEDTIIGSRNKSYFHRENIGCGTRRIDDQRPPPQRQFTPKRREEPMSSV